MKQIILSLLLALILSPAVAHAIAPDGSKNLYIDNDKTLIYDNGSTETTVATNAYALSYYDGKFIWFDGTAGNFQYVEYPGFVWPAQYSSEVWIPTDPAPEFYEGNDAQHRAWQMTPYGFLFVNANKELEFWSTDDNQTTTTIDLSGHLWSVVPILRSYRIGGNGNIVLALSDFDNTVWRICEFSVNPLTLVSCYASFEIMSQLDIDHDGIYDGTLYINKSTATFEYYEGYDLVYSGSFTNFPNFPDNYSTTLVDYRIWIYLYDVVTHDFDDVRLYMTWHLWNWHFDEFSFDVFTNTFEYMGVINNYPDYPNAFDFNQYFYLSNQYIDLFGENPGDPFIEWGGTTGGTGQSYGDIEFEYDEQTCTPTYFSGSTTGYVESFTEANVVDFSNSALCRIGDSAPEDPDAGTDIANLYGVGACEAGWTTPHANITALSDAGFTGLDSLFLADGIHSLGITSDLAYASDFASDTVSWSAGSETIADIIGSIDATNHGATYFATGDFDGTGAFQFDGIDDYIELGYSPDVFGTGSSAQSGKTYVATFRGYGTIEANTVLTNTHFSWDNNFTLSVRPWSQELVLRIDGGAWWQEILYWPVSPDEWYHVVFVANNFDDTASLYVNGQLQWSASHTSDLWDSNPLVVGRAGTFDRYYLEGTVWRVAVYDRRLFAEEVASLYQLWYDWQGGFSTAGTEDFRTSGDATLLYSNASTDHRFGSFRLQGSAVPGCGDVNVDWSLVDNNSELRSWSVVVPAGDSEDVFVELQNLAQYDQVQEYYDDEIAFASTSEASQQAQTFVPLADKINLVSLFKGKDTGTFTGDVSVLLYETTDGTPSGTPTTLATIDNASWLDIPDYTEFSVSSDTIDVVPGDTYAIAIASSVNDANNFASVMRFIASDKYAPGRSYSELSGTWTAHTDPSDLYFRVRYLGTNVDNLTLHLSSDNGDVCIRQLDLYNYGFSRNPIVSSDVTKYDCSSSQFSCSWQSETFCWPINTCYVDGDYCRVLPEYSDVTASGSFQFELPEYTDPSSFDNFNFGDDVRSFSGGIDFTPGLDGYSAIVPDTSHTGACKMFDENGDFLYYGSSTFDFDYDFSQVSDNDLVLNIASGVQNILDQIFEPINQLLAIIRVFSIIPDDTELCYFGDVQMVDYQSVLWFSGSPITALEDYQVEEWDMTFLDYAFLFCAWCVSVFLSTQMLFPND